MKNTISPFEAILAGILVLPNITGRPYLDPGSGSLILQIIIAAAAGGIYMMRNQIARFFSIFRRDKPSKKQASPRKTRRKNAK
jgi:hypothetical protein